MLTLYNFINTFYGYGTYSGRYWMVGMEEGGGESREEIEGRLAAWESFGRTELVDLADSHLYFGVDKYFGERPISQRTWSRLLRTILTVDRGEPPTLDEIKQYQGLRLGRLDGDNCLVELLPLPSPKTSVWLYPQMSNLDYLQTRKAYREHLAPQRAEHLRLRVEEYQPRLVWFYSTNAWYMPWWQHIIGVETQEHEIAGLSAQLARRDGTTFVITRHPVAHGMSNAFCEGLGRLLRSPLSKLE